MTWQKDPDATLDYGIDWAGTSPGPYLETGEVLTSSTWIVPTGIVKATDSFSSTQTTIWLEGGTPGVTYQVTNRVTTSGGRTDDRTLRIHVVDR